MALMLDTRTVNHHRGSMIRTASVALDDIEPPSAHARRDDRLVLKPSTHGHGYEIVAGHRTYERAVRAGRTRVLCLIRSDDASDEFDHIAEIQMGVYDPVDEGKIYADTLRRTGLSQRALAAETGLPQSRISRRMLLLELGAPDRKRLREGDLTIREALDIAMGRRGR